MWEKRDIRSMDQMIDIDSKCIHYIHEQIDGIRGSGEVFLPILTIVSEIQSAQLVHYPTERHIDPKFCVCQ